MNKLKREFIILIYMRFGWEFVLSSKTSLYSGDLPNSVGSSDKEWEDWNKGLGRVII